MVPSRCICIYIYIIYTGIYMYRKKERLTDFGRRKEMERRSQVGAAVGGDHAQNHKELAEHIVGILV